MTTAWIYNFSVNELRAWYSLIYSVDPQPSEEKVLVLSKEAVLEAQTTLEGSLLGTSNVGV